METRFLLFIAAVFAARLPTSRQFQDELNYELPALKNDTESVSARADGEVADCEFGTSCLCKCKPKEGVEPEFCKPSIESSADVSLRTSCLLTLLVFFPISIQAKSASCRRKRLSNVQQRGSSSIANASRTSQNV